MIGTDSADQANGRSHAGGPPSPRAVPLADLSDRFRRDDFAVSIADPPEYGEAEALSRAADQQEVFMPVTAGLLSWFADRNPSGPGFLVVARSVRDGAMIGHFLFYATTLVRADGPGGGREMQPAYLYVRLFVIPQYRRKGVFAAMFAFGVEVLARMGVPFAYTVPNPRSSPGFARFGVPMLGTLPCRMAPPWPAWRAAAALTSPGRPAGTVEPVAGFDLAMTAAAGAGPAAVRGLRTPDLLTWRFCEHPEGGYRIWRVTGVEGTCGYLVTRVLPIQRHRVLIVCDIALRRFEAPTIRAALAEVLRHTAGEKIDVVMLQGGPQDRAARRALLGAGLVVVPARILPQPVAVFGGVPGRAGSTGGLPPLEQWQLTPCDWDVF